MSDAQMGFVILAGALYALWLVWIHTTGGDL